MIKLKCRYCGGDGVITIMDYLGPDGSMSDHEERCPECNGNGGTELDTAIRKLPGTNQLAIGEHMTVEKSFWYGNTELWQVIYCGVHIATIEITEHNARVNFCEESVEEDAIAMLNVALDYL